MVRRTFISGMCHGFCGLLLQRYHASSYIVQVHTRRKAYLIARPRGAKKKERKKKEGGFVVMVRTASSARRLYPLTLLHDSTTHLQPSREPSAPSHSVWRSSSSGLDPGVLRLGDRLRLREYSLRRRPWPPRQPVRPRRARPSCTAGPSTRALGAPSTSSRLWWISPSLYVNPTGTLGACEKKQEREHA